MKKDTLSGSIRIGVVGLGYVGLPTALAFHAAGHIVDGIDASESVVDTLNRGESHLLEGGNTLKIPISSDRWSVSRGFEDVIPECDLVIITVPTPTKEDKNPDLSFVESAMNSTFGNLASGKGTIVVLESTVYPGVTNEVADRAAKLTGSMEGSEFNLGYAPERISPGEVGKSASEVARIVGANDPKIGEYLAGIYSQITSGGCQFVGSIEVAEAAKMIENTQRDIDIAFVNELAIVLPKMGIDVIEVLEAASTKWNCHYHSPGIGVGGHCIPVDPYYYIMSSKSVKNESLISPIARKVNEGMPMHAASLITPHLNEGSAVLILGIAYKPNVGDTRETPVIPLMERLLQTGVRIFAWDPLVDEKIKLPDGVKLIDDPYNIPEPVEGVVLATAHQECLGLNWEKIRREAKKAMIFDGPRALDKKEFSAMGWDYLGVGVPHE